MFSTWKHEGLSMKNYHSLKGTAPISSLSKCWSFWSNTSPANLCITGVCSLSSSWFPIVIRNRVAILRHLQFVPDPTKNSNMQRWSCSESINHIWHLYSCFMHTITVPHTPTASLVCAQRSAATSLPTGCYYGNPPSLRLATILAWRCPLSSMFEERWERTQIHKQASL